MQFVPGRNPEAHSETGKAAKLPSSYWGQSGPGPGTHAPAGNHPGKRSAGSPSVPSYFKGKEIRATGTGVQALEKLGAAPVFLPVSETYEALQKNIIKGIYTTFEIIRPFKFSEVIEYITPFPAPGAVMFTIVKKETFNSWPADVKKVIEDMKMEHSEWAGNYAHKEGLGGLAFSMKKGIKKTTVLPDERAKMMGLLKPLTDDWVKQNSAKGLPAKQWLDEFNKLLAKYNSQY